MLYLDNYFAVGKIKKPDFFLEIRLSTINFKHQQFPSKEYENADFEMLTNFNAIVH
jgi:hypothetical protein